MKPRAITTDKIMLSIYAWILITYTGCSDHAKQVKTSSCNASISYQCECDCKSATEVESISDNVEKVLE